MGTPIPLLINRKEAGIVLATRLQQFQDHPQTLIVRALPRGGVPVVSMISRKLRLPLYVFLTRKLRYPGNPEYANGAITETGYTWFNPDSLKMRREREGGFQNFLKEEIARQQREIKRQKLLYRHGGTIRSLDGYTIIPVDDGIVTGSMFVAPIQSLRTLGNNHLIGAIPVGPAKTLNQIRKWVDHLEVLHSPDPFVAVDTLSTGPTALMKQRENNSRTIPFNRPQRVNNPISLPSPTRVHEDTDITLETQHHFDSCGWFAAG